MRRFRQSTGVHCPQPLQLVHGPCLNWSKHFSSTKSVRLVWIGKYRYRNRYTARTGDAMMPAEVLERCSFPPRDAPPPRHTAILCVAMSAELLRDAPLAPYSGLGPYRRRDYEELP